MGGKPRIFLVAIIGKIKPSTLKLKGIIKEKKLQY
jgi:hypothetical protein